jgi:hypothetical protein
VSGEVSYKGKPVTGGEIMFFTEDGFNGTGRIDEQGHYTVNAPVGNVKVTINNTMVGKSAREAASKGAGPRPGGPEPEPIKGKFMRLPPKYSSPAETDLNYNVKKGAQTINVELKD